MASSRPSGTQFFWPNASLESVERECKRNGDSYKEGYQEGVRGYWITVSRNQSSKAKAKLAVTLTKRDHRIRSASPMLPSEGATPQQTDEVNKETGKRNPKPRPPKHEVNGARGVLTRRLSAVLLEHLDSLTADDNTSIWEGSTAGARYEYVKGDMLGKGSFGEVCKVSVKGYEGSVARKAMFLQSRNRRQVQKEKDRIKREVDNLQCARHKHVVNILDCYTEQEKNFTTYYLIMSPAGDKDLETLLERFPRMPSAEQDKYRKRVSRWFTCLASALAYMHQQGIRHEDIKPSNIIHRGDAVYFTDFSSSRVFKPDFETATTSTVETTRRFAAPEVLNTFDDNVHIRSGNAIAITDKDGKVTYEVPHGRQSDVFSLALVFAEMTTVFQRNIAEMHAFVLVLEKSRRLPLYHEVVDRLGLWFTKELKSERGLRLWQSCLKNMLREKRTSRPSALNIVHTLQREEPVGKFRDDGCQALLPPVPKIWNQETHGNHQKGNATTKATDTRKSDTKGVESNKSNPKKTGDVKSGKTANGPGTSKQAQGKNNQTSQKKEIDIKARKT